jgi:hypothetical protein
MIFYFLLHVLPFQNILQQIKLEKLYRKFTLQESGTGCGRLE